MVTHVTNLGRSGLYDWLIQRVTAVYLALYTLFILGYLLTHPHLDYVTWHTLFQCFLTKLATFTALVSLVLHAWVGLWQVSTDYIKITGLRVMLQLGLGLVSLVTFVWGIDILWG